MNTRQETTIGNFLIRKNRNDRIREHCKPAGYSDEEITGGLNYAYHMGFANDDEALSLTISRILYSDSQLANGARYEAILLEGE